MLGIEFPGPEKAHLRSPSASVEKFSRRIIVHPARGQNVSVTMSTGIAIKAVVRNWLRIRNKRVTAVKMKKISGTIILALFHDRFLIMAGFAVPNVYK